MANGAQNQLLGRLDPSRLARPTRLSLSRGIMTFRWLVAVWAFGVFVYEIGDRNRLPNKTNVAHPTVGLLLLGIVVAWSAVLTLAYRKDADRLLRPSMLFTEIGLASALSFLDVWVYGSDAHSQSLPSIWVVAVVFAVAVAGGTRAAVLTGVGIGASRYVGWLVYGLGGWGSLSRFATIVLLGLAGWSAGYFIDRLAEADREISTFRAREEVARTLHDGVLQTLAVIQRRSDDGDLVTLARSQEADLRQYLFGNQGVETDLATALRAAAAKAEQRYDLRVTVVCAPDLPQGSADQIAALAGATGEALTNASRHGGAHKVTVYAEPDGSAVFVSVKDDGRGFDPAMVTLGEGLKRSITGRAEEVGGRVEIDGRPGRGTEIRMWVS
ncbi:MAG: DUF5931 domain-containing protein [Acidimicrobiales bacterium]